MKIMHSILLFAITTFALRWGGNGGQEHTIQCQSGNYVQAVAFKHWSLVDAIAIRCTTEAWGPWRGGSGGRYDHFYASSSGFCGVSGRDGSLIDRLCLTAVDGESRCYGGDGGSYFNDRSCSDSPGNSRARLIGFRLRSGWYIDGIEPLWDTNNDCKNYLQVSGASPEDYFDGYYAYNRFVNGHHLYKHVSKNRCIYYSHRAWRIIHDCNDAYAGNGYYNIKLPDRPQYNVCPEKLSGHNWYRTGHGYIYPPMQIQAFDSIPLQWGNAIGYWGYVASGSGSAGSATRSYTASVTDTSTTSRTYTETEQQSFSETDTVGHTWGVEFTVGFEDKITGMSASAKYSYALSISHSTTSTVTNSMSKALQHSRAISQTEAVTCTTQAPTGRWQDEVRPWTLYAWTTYRASNIENVGATQDTCEFQYQTGPCRFVPPNCPLGACLDEHCIQCVPGEQPLKSLEEIQQEYPGCIDSLDIVIDARCSLDKVDWSCCTSENPCSENKGDCDSDSDCLGDLVCDHAYCAGNSDCPHSSFDVCVQPGNRRRSLEGQGFEADQTRRLLEKNRDSTTVDKAELDMVKFYEKEEEKQHDMSSGCGQFDDEGHCTAGPLYRYCTWSSTDRQCVKKENVKDEEVAGDYTYLVRNE